MGSTALGTASGAPCRRRQRFAQRQTRISHCERPTENRIRTPAAKCQNFVILAFTTREIAHLPTGTHDPEPPLRSESDQTGQVAVLPLLAISRSSTAPVQRPVLDEQRSPGCPLPASISGEPDSYFLAPCRVQHNEIHVALRRQGISSCSWSVWRADSPDVDDGLQHVDHRGHDAFSGAAAANIDIAVVRVVDIVSFGLVPCG